MNLEILEKAKELQRNIETCKKILNENYGYNKFSAAKWSEYSKQYFYEDLPKPLNDKIMFLIKQQLEEFEKELEEL